MDYLHEFNSLDDLVNYAETTDAAPDWDCRSDDNKEHEWAFGLSVKGACDMSRTGWKEGRDAIRGKMIDAKAKGVDRIMTRAAMFTNDVVGFRPDMGAYNAGAPDCMLNYNQGGRTLTAPVINLNIGLGYINDATATEIANYGAAVCLLVDQLTESGQSVQVNMIRHCLDSRRKGEYFTIKVPAKKAGEPLDVDKMAFMLAHPAMSRRLCFRIMETTEGAAANFNAGYGSSRTHEDLDLPSVRTGDGHNYRSQCKTIEGAIEIVAKLWEKSQSPDGLSPIKGGE